MKLLPMLMLLGLSLLSLHATNLHEIIDLVKKSDLAQSQSYQAASSAASLSAAKRAYLPKFEASYMYSYLAKEHRSFLDPEQSGSISASMVLFDGFGRYHNISAASSAAKAADLNARNEVDNLTLNAIKLYYNILTLDQSIAASKQKELQLKDDVARLEKLYASQTLSEDKLQDIKAAYAMTQYQRILEEQNREELAFSLQSLTHHPLEHLEISHFKEPDFTEKGLPLDIQAQEQNIQALYHQAQAKSSSYWPTILLKDTLSGTEYYPSNLSGIGITIPTVTNKLQIVAQMTFFDFFSKSKEKEALMLKKLSAEKALSYKKRDEDLKQKLAKIKLQTSQKQIAAAKSSLEAAQKSYDYTQKRYAVNLVDSGVYLDALTQLTQSKAMLSSAENAYQIALAEYYFNFSQNLKEKIQ